MQEPTNPDELLTIADVAEETKFSTRTVERWIASGSLRTLSPTPGRLRATRRIRRRDLNAFLDSTVVESV